MADSVGVASNGHPNLNLTSEEKRAYGQLFKEADPDGFGAVSGDVAVKFFERTRLAPDVLGQIWQIADTENRGFLTPSGFGVVLRLIGHAQAGRPPSAQVATQPAPLPKFDGGQNQAAAQAPPQPPTPVQPPPLSAQLSGSAASPTTGGAPIRVPPLSPDKVAEYSTLFDRSGAENGMLSGVVAKQIFERARLPNEVLGRIWGLSDTQARGSLDVTEFVIAMHLLASVKSGAMRGVPSTLPPGLYDAASRRPPNRLASGTPQRPSSATGPPPGISPQFSGYSASGAPQSPISRAQVGTPLSQQSTGEAWAISAADKARFDQIYATVDKQGLGYITGEQAVQFFGNARLSEETLAQIWDLSDINSEGRLNKDEFAVAMYLIRQQRATRGVVPQTLPQNLIPPSMRKQPTAPPAPTAPAFGNAPVTQPRSAAEDLFGLDVSDPQAPPAQQAPQSTGSTDAFGTPRSPVTTQTTGTASTGPSSHFRPFIPTSGFGQSLVPGTGPGSASQAKAAQAGGDLLDDNEPASNSKITNDAAELGNLSNEVTSLSKETNDLHASRGRIEQDLSQNAGQKRAFQERLTQLRAAYDQEVQQVKTLKEQLAASQADTKKVQQEMAMLEGSHADLQTQHQQLSTALTTDQQENASLKEKIRQMNAEVEKLKPQLEKLKSDARQQKGLVAINKKQLATNEAERDRILADIATAQKEHEDAIKEAEESKRQADEAAQRSEAHQKELEETRALPKPAPVSAIPAAVVGAAAGAAVVSSRSPPPTVTSPAPSTSSNPFFRRQDSGAVFSPPMGSAIQSPEPVNERHDAFDSIFGPSVGTATEAPSTSFGAPPDHHEFPAPPEAPLVAEPPPPAPANQIESDALPLRVPMQREESVTSSVKVAPPASRLSPANTPRAFTPDTSTASPASHRPDDPFHASAVDEEQESVRQTLPRPETQERLDVIPGAFPDTSRSTTPAQHVDPTTVAVGAGVAAVAVGAGLAAAATHDEDTKEDTSVAKPKEPATDTFDDFFGGPAHKKTQSEQLADFDSAFASMGPPPAANGAAGSRNQEFPDIQELEDDESDSSDEEPSHGFDDNFAAPPKPTQAGEVAAGKQPEAEPTATETLQPPRPTLDTASTSSSLPPADRVASPPDYHEAVPEDNPNQFPREYKNLLPEREDPTSPLGKPGGSTVPGPNASVEPPDYGPEIGQATRGTNPLSPPPTKAAPFDFDSAFSNMGAAPVEDDDSESEYDEFTPGGAIAPAKSPHEFDPSFDSPAASTKTTGTTATANAPTSHPQPSALTYDTVTSPGSSTAAPTTNGTKAGTNSDSFNFDASAASRPPPAAPVAATATQAPAISHDWDALFAPLSSAPAITATADEPEAPPAPLRRETTRTEIAPGQSATTTAGEISGTATPLQFASTAAALPNPPVTSTLPPPANKLERPTPGRALSTGTEHDDPILKRLTAMGWSRADSLAALEKFDYNIDKAADYLTFSS